MRNLKIKKGIFALIALLLVSWSVTAQKQRVEWVEYKDTIGLKPKSLRLAPSTSIYKNISRIAEETNLLKIYNLTDGKRPYISGDILGDVNYFHSETIPIEAGKRYAAVSSNTGVTPIFAFYNSDNAGSSSLVARYQSGQGHTAPVGSTHLVFSSLITLKDSFILQQLDSGFPTLNQVTYIYKDVYKRNEVYSRDEVNSTTVSLQQSIKDKSERIAKETNLLKYYGIVEGSRISNDGYLLADSNRFRSNFIPITSGERLATISHNTGQNTTYNYYTDSIISPSTYISFTTGQESTAPTNSQYVIVWNHNDVKDDLIVQKLSSGFPQRGQNTFEYNSVKTVPAWYGEETNVLKQSTTEIIDYYRIANAGYSIKDLNHFRTNLIPVKAGDRYVNINENSNPVATARYSFYSKNNLTTSNFISYTDANEVTVPNGAFYMVFEGDLPYKESYILQKRTEGFPEIGERTVTLTDTYDKEYLEGNFAKAKWYPNVFQLDITYTVSANKIYVIDENETLYGTNGFREIIKATQPDLSDKVTVCTLQTSVSTLTSLVKVSDTKFVGYVVNPTTTSETGFWIFENANTNSWTQRKAVGDEVTTFSKMQSGFADAKFQNFFRVPSNGYIYACSYSTGVNGGKNRPDLGAVVDPAPISVYRSVDEGDTWTIVYNHPSSLNSHMHAVEFDPFRDRIWGLVGDHNHGGTPSIIYSDDWGDNWVTMADKDGTPRYFMGTSIIPTRKYVLFGSDQQPAAIWKWEPQNDVKNATAYAEDLDLSFYPIPEEGDGGQNFGFARRHGQDTSTYPYKIVVPFSHTETYSKAGYFLSPNFRDWYMLNLEHDPINNPNPVAISGILSNGTVIGWGNGGGNQYYITFQFPNWIKN